METKEPVSNALEYHFDTANSPFSEKALAQIAQQHPGLTLELRHAEVGCATQGRILAQAGRIIKADHSNIPSTLCEDDERYEQLIEHLNNHFYNR